MALLTMGLASCSEDFETTTKPLSNPQESILQVADVQFTPTTVTSINLTDYKTNDNPIILGTVSVKEGALASDMKLKAIVQVAKAADFSDAKEIEAESLENSNEIRILPSKLQDLYINGFTLDPNPTTLYLRTNLYTVIGEESQASLGNPMTTFYGTYTVAFTPYDEAGIYISNAYYIICQDLDGNYVETKCFHSKSNVYDDPIFTITIDALKNTEGIRVDTKYAFVAEEDLATFKAGDMSVLYGAGEEKNSLVKGGNFIVGPAEDGASKYKLTIDMKGLTCFADPEIIFYCYYLYTNSAFNMKIEDSDTYENYMFYMTEKNTYIYTTFWPNNDAGKSDRSIKVWERKAMKANATGTVWGFEGGRNDERYVSGTFKQPGQWFGPQTEGWYTLTITMDEVKKIYKYKWDPIAEPSTNYEEISIVGATETKLTKCAAASHNWSLLNYKLDDSAELKFRANNGKEWGGDGSQTINQSVYTMPTGNESIKVPAGTYNLHLNDITGNWTILKVE